MPSLNYAEDNVMSERGPCRKESSSKQDSVRESFSLDYLKLCSLFVLDYFSRTSLSLEGKL